MLDIVLLTALIIAVLTFFLCLNQITKRIKKPAEASLPHENTSLFTAYLLRITISALLLFLLFAFLSHYYFDQLHDFFTLASMALISGCFVVFLIFTLLSEKLQRYIDARIDLLRKETMSRLLRHFLYVGALTGIATVLLSAGYTFLVAQQPQMVIDFFLLPIYASALFLFWLRFRVALVARASDYAFELIKRQEAALPLAGEHNPLWKLRLDFAAINRFLFYHLEFFILCVVALLVAGQTEKFIAFTNALSGFMALSVFSIGICAA
ncbi:MAG TPA: hypothetical protein PLY93_09225, partial [Turneriella sp.]|nr:hypothetical protein [Turneriella sp.]